MVRMSIYESYIWGVLKFWDVEYYIEFLFVFLKGVNLVYYVVY